MVSTAEGLRLAQQGFAQLGGGMTAYGTHKELAKGAGSIMKSSPEEWEGGEEGKKQAAAMYRTGQTAEAEKLRVQPKEIKSLEHMLVNAMMNNQPHVAKAALDIMSFLKSIGARGGGGGAGMPSKGEAGFQITLKGDQVDYSDLNISPTDWRDIGIEPAEKGSEGFRGWGAEPGKPSRIVGNPFADKMNTMFSEYQKAHETGNWDKYREMHGQFEKFVDKNLSKAVGGMDNLNNIKTVNPESYGSMKQELWNQSIAGPYKVINNQLVPGEVRITVDPSAKTIMRQIGPTEKKMIQQKRSGATLPSKVGAGSSVSNATPLVPKVTSEGTVDLGSFDSRGK